MSHKLSKSDPLFYKTAFKGLLDAAKENGVTVTLKGNRVTFDDRMEFLGEIIINTTCSVELEVQE